MKILYSFDEPFPTFRADIEVLFGKCLPRFGITSDLIAEGAPGHKGEIEWGGGKAFLYDRNDRRMARQVRRFAHNVWILVRYPLGRYDAVQIRNMPFIGLCGLIIARCKRTPFYYWLSFPISESQIERAKARGRKAGMGYWGPLVQGYVGKWVLYRLVLPHADHVFVQTEWMRKEVARHGVGVERMTAVPMGVDTETAQPDAILPSDDPRLRGKRVVVYLGTLDRARKIELLVEMLGIVRRSVPDSVLVLVGDTADLEYRAWLVVKAEEYGVADAIIWTGWLPMQEGWRYVRAAEVALSPIPRGPLFDVGSPTKAIEYLALGVPIVCNDNPDQAQVVRESQAGLCVPLTAEQFAWAVNQILADHKKGRIMGQRGRAYVLEHRGYAGIASRLAQSYKALCTLN